MEVWRYRRHSNRINIQFLFIHKTLFELHRGNCIFFEESEIREALPYQISLQYSNLQEFGFENILAERNPQRETINSMGPITRARDLPQKDREGNQINEEATKTGPEAYSISQLINIQPNTNGTIPRKKQNCDNPPKKRSLYQIFRPHYAQTGNKNFPKFLLSKISRKFKQKRSQQNPQWYNFNQQIAKNQTPTKRLQQLFKGDTHAQFKKMNRCLVNEMLHEKQFYYDYFFSSKYIRREQNRKQYLLAAKVYSLRCVSRLLMHRVQTR